MRFLAGAIHDGHPCGAAPREGAAMSNHCMDGTSASPGRTAGEYRVVVERDQLVARFAIVAFALLLVHSVLTVYHYQVEEIEWIPWRQLFDVDEENNLPTWFSGFLLGVTAFWVWIVALAKRRSSDRWWVHWMLLAAGFFLLCIDEIAGLHETVNSVTDVTWAIPGGILALLVGVMLFQFLWSLPAGTRNAFILAGGIYVGGAVGVEIIGEPMDADTMLYNLTTVAEEGMEMAGVIMFLAALLRCMPRSHEDRDEIEVTVGVSE